MSVRVQLFRDSINVYNELVLISDRKEERM